MKRELLIDCNRGIYIPNTFYKNFDFGAWGLDRNDYKDLCNVESPHYWEAWDDLISAAKHIDDEGLVWNLEQDDDLFAVVYEIEELESWNI